MASRDHFSVSSEAAQSSGEAIEDRKRKKTMGRQKIQIKRIDSEQKRQVCFSKRKDGLFKKASDLAVLCGAHVAAVAFSPGGKPFSFGHPSVQALVERFTAPSVPAAPPAAPMRPAALLEEFNREEDFLVKALEAEASRKKALDAAMRQAGVWTGGGVMNDKSLPDLLSMYSALEKVRDEVAVRLQELMAQEAMATGAGGMFMAAGEVNNSQHHDDQAVMDTRMMMLPPYSHYSDLINRGAGYGGHGPVSGVEGFYYGAMALQPF